MDLYYIIEALQYTKKAGDYFMEATDNELVRRIMLKDENAFAELIRRYGGLIKAIVRYHLKDISMWQDDCINDILFALWQNIDRFDAEKNTLKNWLGAVAKYRAINYKKKFYRDITAGELSEDITDGTEVDMDIIKQEIEAETMSLLSGLKEEDKEIFIKRYFMEQSAEDIAAAKNKNTAWVYNRLSRGRKKLRRIYCGKWSDYHEKRI